MGVVRILFPMCLACLVLAGASFSRADELDDLLMGFGDEPAAAEEQGELEQLLGGFDDAPVQNSPESNQKKILPDWLDISGSLSIQAVAGFAHDAPREEEADYRGLSMLRTRGELIADVTLSRWKARLGSKGFYDAVYSIQGRSNYTEKLLNEYEEELELTEAWAQTSLGEHLDVKMGRQIVVWGKSDNIRVTDILNPLDLRQPGMLDIRDLRLPVAMTKFDYYVGNWNVSPVVVHEPRFNKTPVFNGEFFPGDRPLPPVSEPSVSMANQQYGAAVNGVFSGWDLSIYAASVFDDRAHVGRDLSGDPVRQHSRVTMFGFAADVALGNWLFKTEAAYLDGLEFSNPANKDFSRLDVLFGLEYSGFTETIIAVELANRHIFDFDARLAELPDGQQEDLVQSVIRLTQDFMHDTLHLTMLLSSYGIFGEDGAFQRYQLEYDVYDDIMVKGGMVFYQSGDFQPFQDIDDNDRIFLEMEYRF